MGDVAVTGRILEADPQRRLVQTWGAAWPWILASMKTLRETGRPMAGAGA